MKLLLLLLFLAALTAQARMVTIIADAQSKTNTFELAGHETLYVRSYLNYAGNPILRVNIKGHKAAFGGEPNSSVFPVVGPATVSFEMPSPMTDTSHWAWVTLEIVPESFPPDKTIVIPEGSAARIALECSTNLTHWAEVYSETHTNAPSNKFFRIRAERILP
jgi:hypothetical protein